MNLLFNSLLVYKKVKKICIGKGKTENHKPVIELKPDASKQAKIKLVLPWETLASAQSPEIWPWAAFKVEELNLQFLC